MGKKNEEILGYTWGYAETLFFKTDAFLEPVYPFYGGGGCGALFYI